LHRKIKERKKRDIDGEEGEKKILKTRVTVKKNFFYAG
jgi:hypothetical protein